MLPANTTLIRVLGPGVPEYFPLPQCYATLDPEPAWWRPDSYQGYSQHWKMRNVANRSMFIIPIDPTVHTMLRVGDPGPTDNSNCFISAVQTYPFH